MAATEKRIVVTGLGTVTALGSGDQFWDNLLAGESGIDTITAFDASRFPTTIGAECKDFDAKACSTSLGVLPTGAPSSWPTHRREARATTQSHAAEPDITMTLYGCLFSQKYFDNVKNIKATDRCALSQPGRRAHLDAASIFGAAHAVDGSCAHCRTRPQVYALCGRRKPHGY